MFDNLRLENVRVGVAAINNVRVTINRPVLAGNSFAGIFASGTSTEVNASNSVISSNATGVQNAAGTVAIRLANNDITLNDTAISGATQTYGNNRRGRHRPDPDQPAVDRNRIGAPAVMDYFSLIPNRLYNGNG